MSITKLWIAIQTSNIAMEIEIENFGASLQEDDRKIENVQAVANGYNIVWSEYWKLKDSEKSKR